MKWRTTSMAVLTIGLAALACARGADEQRVAKTPPKPAAAKATRAPATAPVAVPAEGTIHYVPGDAPAGTSQAVVVDGYALVHTRQLLPTGRDGKVTGKGSVKEQVKHVLDNLETVLKAAGSGLDKLVRVNVYALAPSTVEEMRNQLKAKLEPTARPAMTAVLTPMPDRDALVAVDAVAVVAPKENAVVLKRCNAVAGDAQCADVGVLPAGGVAYLSGVPAECSLTVSAVDKSMATLIKLLGELELAPKHVVRLKVFLRPATSADEVRQQIKKFFPGQLMPPVVFVEWLAPLPVEIEAVAQLPGADKTGPTVTYYNPPYVRPLQIFSRVALVRPGPQIFVSGLFARKPGRGQEQALDVFDQLETVLKQSGSDLRHLAKGTYYVCDDSSARGMDRARLWLYDQDRPPAASKCMVHGVGMAKRTLTMDMIAVPAK